MPRAFRAMSADCTLALGDQPTEGDDGGVAVEAEPVPRERVQRTRLIRASAESV